MTRPEDEELVSVILPTHNRAHCLSRAIASVLGQTYQSLELIVVDDGSTDETAACVARFKDPRLRFLVHPERTGAAAARNLGISEARGNLIAFQDSDDEWLARKLEDQVRVLRESTPSVGWVGGAHLIVTGESVRLVSPTGVLEGQDYERELLSGEAFVTPTWLTRRCLLGEAGMFNIDLANLEDWDLILRLASLCDFRAVSSPVLVRYASPDSLFGDLETRGRALRTILQDHYERWARHPAEHAAARRALADLEFKLGGTRAALRELIRSLIVQPVSTRSYGQLFVIGLQFARRYLRQLRGGKQG